MKTYRVGLIGAGAIARKCHAPGYASAKNCELAAVADPVASSRAALREAGFHFKKEYSDWREMLELEKPDVVSICTPNKYHAEMAVACLDAGADVLLEKPVALSVAEADSIQVAVERTGRRLMVGFSHRFNELNEAALSAVKEGKIGEPYMIRVRFAHMGPWPGWAQTDWFYNPELAGGGALMDMAVHALDIVQVFCGAITAVSGKTATLRKNIPLDDNVVAILEFGNRCMGYIECGWTSPSGFIGIEIMGDNGAICSDYIRNRVVMQSGVISPSGKNEMKEFVLKEGSVAGGAWIREMLYFTSHLESGEAFCPGIREGKDTLKAVLAAYESSSTGKRIEL